MLRFKSSLKILLLVSASIPLAGLFIFNLILPKLHWEQVFFYYFIESVDSFIAIMLAMLILFLQRKLEIQGYYIWVSSALAGMGILGGFRSSVPPGNSFIWLHVIGALTGGFLFAGILLPGFVVKSRHIVKIIIAAAVAAAALGLFSIGFPESLPLMAGGSAFSPLANAIEIIAAAFFLLSGFYLIMRWKSGSCIEDFLFANFCLLNSWAAIIFPFSKIWNGIWWLWHLLRFLAFMGIFSYMFIKFSQAQKELSSRRAVEKTHSQLMAILESADDAIISKDLSGMVLSWNCGAENIYGYSAKEIIGKSIFVLSPPERSNELMEVLARVRQGEVVKYYEAERIRKDGQRVYVSLTVSSLVDSAGRVIGVSTISRDISARKKMEEQLRIAFAYARSLIEASLDPLVTINKDGKITDVNEATIQATGISREKIIGTDFSDYFTDSGKAREGYRQVFAKGFVSDYPLTIRHKDGKLIDVLYNATVYKDDRGNILGVFAAARDVTLTKQASLYARSLIEASLDPLVTINKDGKITDVNEATIQATGISREKIIGTDFSDYFTDSGKAREGYRHVFAKGFVSDYPLTIRHKDGKLIDVLYNATVYKDDRGNILGVFATARDVTERESLEREKQKKIDELERFRKAAIEREFRIKELYEERERLKAERKK